MKIVVAQTGKSVAQHFGHCENFVFFDTENGKIVNEQVVPNPGHKPGFLPNFLADRGAKVIIAGGGRLFLAVCESHNNNIKGGIHQRKKYK